MAPQPKQPGSKVALTLLQRAAALIAGCCFGYGLGSLLLGHSDKAIVYGALGIALYAAAILPAPSACDASTSD